jgi:plasmid stabilization system protein ParE
MKVLLREAAAADLESIFAWIAKDIRIQRRMQRRMYRDQQLGLRL